MKNELFINQSFEDVPKELEEKVIKEFDKQFPTLNKRGSRVYIFNMINLKDYKVVVLSYYENDESDDCDDYWCIIPHDNPDKFIFQEEGSYESIQIDIDCCDFELCNALCINSESPVGISLKSYRQQIKELICDMIMKDEIKIDIYSSEYIDYKTTTDFCPAENYYHPTKVFNVICKE